MKVTAELMFDSSIYGICGNRGAELVKQIFSAVLGIAKYRVPKLQYFDIQV